MNGNSENAKCHNDSSGIISVFPSGGSPPYQYLWSTQDTTPSITVAAGRYSLTLVDSYDCRSDTSFTIHEPDQILAYIDANPDTNMAGLGMISLDVFGGTPPYEINWSDAENQTGSVAQNLVAGDYSVQITDAHFCERYLDITIQNISLNNVEESRNSDCEFTCVNQPNSVLIKFSEYCDESISLAPLRIINLQGQSIDYEMNTINTTSKELNLKESGVFFVLTNNGQLCKIIKMK